MNTTDLFLHILKTSLHDKRITRFPKVSNSQWEDLYELSEQQAVSPLIYQQIYQQKGFLRVSKEFQSFWRTRTLHYAATQARRTALFLALYQEMLDVGFRPLVVKGIICRALYPHPDLRVSGDEDLLIPRDNFKEFDTFLLQRGFTRETLENNRVYQEVSYLHENGLHLEVHMDLFPKDSGAYGYWNELFEHVLEHPFEVALQGNIVYTMEPKDHFLYLILHGLKHFMHSGFGIRQVCDMMIFACTYQFELPWGQIKATLKGYHMYDFAMNVLDLGVTHLGFTWEDIGLHPPLDVTLDSTPLLVDMLEGGVFGQTSENRIHSANITLNAAEKNHCGRVSGILTSLFPEKQYIKTNYRYTRKLPFLIPIAYLQRIFGYFSDAVISKKLNAKNSTQIGMDRIALLRKYKIVRK